MIKWLHDELRRTIEPSTDKTSIDVTPQLRSLFDSEDRCIVKARLMKGGIEKQSKLLVFVGLRSEISQFEFPSESLLVNYLPCDIVGLIPSLASIVVHQGQGLIANALACDIKTRLVLVFGETCRSSEESLHGICTSIWRFFRKWNEWGAVFTSMMNRDQLFADAGMDWRRFLFSESHEFSCADLNILSFEERATYLERIVTNSKVFLSSILSGEQMGHPLIQNLLRWMRSLVPILSRESAHITEEVNA